jgi:hypothetical protein
MNNSNDLSRKFGWAANYCQSPKQPHARRDFETAGHLYRSKDGEFLTASLRLILGHRRWCGDSERDQYQTHCRPNPAGGFDDGWQQHVS